MFNKLKRVFDSIESSKVGFGWWILSFLSVIVIRNFLEGVLESNKVIGFIDGPYLALLVFFGHYFLFYISQFLIMVIILSLLSRERVEKVSKTVMVFWIITWSVPVIDFFFSGGQGEILMYFRTVNDVRDFFINCANPWASFQGNASPGIRIEVVTVSFLGFVYVFVKTGNLMKSLAGAVLFYLSFIFYVYGLFAILAGICKMVFPQFYHLDVGAVYDKLYSAPSLIVMWEQRFAEVFIFVIAFSLFIWYFLYDRKKCWALLKNIRLTRSVHYCGLVAAGILLGYLVEGKNIPGVFTNPVDYLACAGLCLSIFFAFQSMIVVNDIFDVESDRISISNQNRPLPRGIIAPAEYKIVGLFYFLLSLYLAWNVSVPALIIVVSFTSLYTIYSIPPFRLKNIFPVNMLVIAVNSLLAMLLGYSLLGGAKAASKFPAEFMALIPFVYFLTANIIAIKDIEADRQTGAATLPVLLGEKWGKIFIAILVLSSYLAVPVILGIRQLWIAAVPFGILAGLLVLRKKWQEASFFIVYFIFFVIMFWMVWLSGKYA